MRTVVAAVLPANEGQFHNMNRRNRSQKLAWVRGRGRRVESRFAARKEGRILGGVPSNNLPVNLNRLRAQSLSG